MVHIEKRTLIWGLHESSSRVLGYLEKQKHGSMQVDCNIFIPILASFGFEESPVLHEILGLAVDHDDQIVDANLLFQVIAQAVSRILDRNALFWNTVMTVSSSSIPWIDFRRKLSKWLSASGKDVLSIKRIVSFVQENVDRQSTGLVRKDTFLRFVDQLMGVDCLLYLDEFSSINSLSSKPIVPVTLKSTTSSVRGSPTGQRAVVLIQKDIMISKVKTSPKGYEDPKTRFIEQVQTNKLPPLMSKRDDQQETLNASENGQLVDIRVRLGVGIVTKLLDSRMRWWFVMDGIRERKKACVPDARIQYMLLCIKSVMKRREMNAFSKMARYSPVSQVVQDLASDEGPSWSVTIQAVAVTNLFGIMRSAFVRARLPSFLSLKAGRCVDDPYSPPPILYAQSNQGKKDSQVAMGGTRKGVLQAIDENSNLVEFDLSH